METIFALATARGKSGVAIIRVSGGEAFAVARRLAGIVPEPGRFVYRRLRDADGILIDHGLVLAFCSPASFTGEDVVEFQVHGSLAVVDRMQAVIAETGLARPAEAGEFTRRALLNDRMDLGQVEALGDLIAAETEQQRLSAMRMMSGALREVAEKLRADLLRAIALIEATIDFADEEVPVDVTPEVREILGRILVVIRKEIDGSRVSERLREGFEVAVLGPPNAGKSTLLNRIAGRDVAITSELAGTTRDVIEVRLDLNGLPVTFLDTAGLRETRDVLELEGIERARLRARDADLRVILTTGTDDFSDVKLSKEDLVYIAKDDNGDIPSGLSGLTGYGVEAMLAEVEQRLHVRLGRAGTANRMRHRVGLQAALDEIAFADVLLSEESSVEEVTALHLREAVRAIDELVGAIGVEDVLGEIFSQFCIGK